jgi:hypothetical protein
MAEEKKKELTAAEKAEKAKKDAEEKQKYDVKTLESKLFSEGLGAQDVLANQSEYGRKGKVSAQALYDEIMQSPEALSEKNKEYQSRKKVYQANGIYGDPSALSDGDLVYLLQRQRNEALQGINLGNLEGILGKLGVKRELPKQFKEYSYEKLYAKGTDNGKLEEIDEKKLSPEENNALQAYTIMASDYISTCALKASIKYQSAANDAAWKEVMEKYAPKDKPAEAKPADKKK